MKFSKAITASMTVAVLFALTTVQALPFVACEECDASKMYTADTSCGRLCLQILLAQAQNSISNRIGDTIGEAER
ncbi:MAG: hypothetical protein J3R72DRAFT_443499 [Linnemannia gamsii]|nr:MAG: hypothetical protein J3R72DRAFT_443499 [Linnemannia gamsii]